MIESDDFWNSINEDAKNEQSGRLGNFPTEGVHDEHTNYEILPIQELRLQGKKLNIENYLELNKQELIEAIRKAKTSRQI